MEWIKITEDTPPVQYEVLICHEKDKWMEIGYLRGGEWYNNYDNDCECYPTHWKYLPQYPKQSKSVWQYSTKQQPDVWHDATDEAYEQGKHLSRFLWRRIEK